jgi:TIR domain
MAEVHLSRITRDSRITKVGHLVGYVMKYEYVAFFSYKRDPQTNRWHEALVDKIQYWLGQELVVDKPRIFFDTRSIENGHDFDEFIRDSLRSSVVMISVFSPLYFTSKWCLSELHTFYAREEQLKIKKGSLIASAQFHDGENYPPYAQRMQSDDFRNFAILHPKFWDSEAALHFDQIIKDFAIKVAKKIRAAPPYSDNFPLNVVPDDGVQVPGVIGRPSSYVSATAYT